MLESVLGDIGEEKFTEYRAKRFYSQDLKLCWWHLKHNIKSFFTYTLFRSPYVKLKIKFHKFFNTKQGQWYKKHNF